jgi:hypothetical protein
VRPDGRPGCSGCSGRRSGARLARPGGGPGDEPGRSPARGSPPGWPERAAGSGPAARRCPEFSPHQARAGTPETAGPAAADAPCHRQGPRFPWPAPESGGWPRPARPRSPGLRPARSRPRRPARPAGPGPPRRRDHPREWPRRRPATRHRPAGARHRPLRHEARASPRAWTSLLADPARPCDPALCDPAGPAGWQTPP